MEAVACYNGWKNEVSENVVAASCYAEQEKLNTIWRSKFAEMLTLLSILMFFLPALFSLVIHSCLRHGELSGKRKIIFFTIYLIIINAITYFVSYVRGVKAFHFVDMTVSYRLKYMGLGCVLGFILPFFICLMTEDIITIGGFKGILSDS